MNDSVIKTIGLIGAGHIGSQIARLAVANSYNVVISNSRGPETLSGLVAELGSESPRGNRCRRGKSRRHRRRHDPAEELPNGAR